MNKTWIALALILIIAGQLIVLSSFHEVSCGGFSGTNTAITIAKLNYVNARVTITVTATPPTSDTNGTTDVKIICPDGNIINLTSSNWDTPKTFTKTFSFPRTGDNGGYSAGDLTVCNRTISVSQEEPLAISVDYGLSDPQNYQLSYSDQVMQVFTFLIYGAASVSVSGYGVAL